MAAAKPNPTNPNQKQTTSVPPIAPLTASQLRGGIQAIQQMTASRGRADIPASEIMSWMQGQLAELEQPKPKPEPEPEPPESDK